ncbi:MAG: hypothetical protein P8008_04695, partial [Gammaproteobacteria bacterium]
MRNSSRSTDLRAFLLPLALLYAAGPGTVCAAETVAEFSGSSSRTTAEFEVEAPWLLDWRVSSD